jgi:beta-fructofuranosidase
MNDPNGLIHWQGRYHLFYQHHPHGAYWSDMHWGHAASPDLVHWTHLPVALAPTPGGPDKDGCFSGCAVADGGVPTLVYTGVRPEVQCLATSADGLITWQKYPANPVIAAPPEGLAITGFRDPYVWRDGDAWYMALGSGVEGVGGMVLLYCSPDLVRWEYLGPLCTGDKARSGEMWECPNLVSLGERHVLIVSPYAKVLYFSGRYAGHRFRPEVQGVVDWGHFYAPQVFTDAQGRRIMFGWVTEGRNTEAQRAAGWSGVMSLPRLLSLRPDGLLGMEPAPELQALRGRHHHAQGVALAAGAYHPLEVAGNSLEIVALFEPGDARRLGLEVRCSPDGAERTAILYDQAEAWLGVRREHSSLCSDVEREAQGGPFALADGEPLRLHLFLDRSLLEVYANGRFCLTSRIYPTRADSLGLRLFAGGGAARLSRLDVWLMSSIWVQRD